MIVASFVLICALKLGGISQAFRLFNKPLYAHTLPMASSYPAAILAVFATAGACAASNHNPRSASALNKSCHDGDQDACAALGTQLALRASADGPTLDYARTLIEAACNAGSANGCRRLADLYLRGIAVARDHNRAEVLLDLSCAQHNATACLRAGLLYTRSEQPTKALEPLTTSCLVGAALACAQLAAIYAVGGTVDQDRLRASWLYYESCSAGCQVGCEGLADILSSGDIEPAEEMLITLATACEGGQSRVCDSVAAIDPDIPQPIIPPPIGVATACSPDDGSSLYEDGTLDIPTIVYEKGCSMGDEASCAHLSLPHALLLAESKCTRGSLAGCLFAAESAAGADAVPHYRSACELNHAHSCALLGVWYMEGTGIPSDEEQGRLYLNRACSLGNTMACDELAKRHLTP